MEMAQRRVLIQYPKRQTARGMQQERSHLPIKVNTAGVIPPIFASSLLLMPLTVIQWMGRSAGTQSGGINDWLITISTYLNVNSPLYLALYGAGIIFFCFFYTAVQFNSEETAENLKRHGGFIPGIRPGKATEQYFDYLLTRITVVGSVYLAVICLIPQILEGQAGINSFRLGGTSLLIVVNVTIDTMSQIQSHLIAHEYGNLIKKAKLKSGRRR
jgi:preprotein translocase subunit SecY